MVRWKFHRYLKIQKTLNGEHSISPLNREKCQNLCTWCVCVCVMSYDIHFYSNITHSFSCSLPPEYSLSLSHTESSSVFLLHAFHTHANEDFFGIIKCPI